MLAIEVATSYIQMNLKSLMKKAITIILTILTAIIILDSFNFAHNLTMFILAGVVPGTNFVVTADAMLVFFAFTIGFTLARVSTYAIRSIAQYQTERTKLRRQPKLS